MATHENMICSQILTSDDLKKLEIAKDNIETIITQILDDKILNRDNWEEICRIIQLQNCLKNEDDDYNPADPRAEELLKKRAEARKKLATAKSLDESELNFADL